MSSGLRERKKLKLRRAIQAEALRLFEADGYEQTTVEHIAEAAETSTSTFYRYFPTKEDVVLDDDADELIEALAADRPDTEQPLDIVRSIIDTVVAAAERDPRSTLIRLKLVATVPALDARYAGQERETVDLLCRVLTARTGRARDDYQLTLVVASLVAVLFTATRRWALDNGNTPLRTLVDQAVDTVQPLLASLQRERT